MKFRIFKKPIHKGLLLLLASLLLMLAGYWFMRFCHAWRQFHPKSFYPEISHTDEIILVLFFGSQILALFLCVVACLWLLIEVFISIFSSVRKLGADKPK